MSEHLRIPPQSVEAEQFVLGGLMLDGRAYDRVADLLAPADFYRRDHQLIYQAIVELASKRKPCDAVTVGDVLVGQGLGDEIAGGSYLVTLANTVPSAANIAAYAGIVAEKSRLRKLIDISTSSSDKDVSGISASTLRVSS